MMAKRSNRVSLIVLVASVLGLVAILVAASVPVKAQQDSSGFPSITVESYTYGGVTYQYSGGSIPVGATIDFRVWVDLYNIDPVKIAYGDGSSDSASLNGAFTFDFYHAYQTAATYAPVAYMPTDSGTFTGSVSQPITIGGGSAPNGGGNSGGNSGQIGTFDVPATVTVIGVMIGVIAVVVAVIPVGTGGAPIQATSYPSSLDTVVLGDATTPQLLRSPETEKTEEAKAHNKQCNNLKSRYDDARKQAKLARTFEEQYRKDLAISLQKLPYDYLKEYVKDKVTDAAREIPLDVMMTLLGVEEFNILRKICEYAAEKLVADGEPGAVGKLWETFNGFAKARDEAQRLEDLANFWLNEFKSTCPDWF